ncbi:MAG: hypothetical protein A2719_01385 [Candidatus Ryanbacteria bacterium RIFCSPHIGHO2_01_FULL_45_22]|nr:MAG: hypothetical protein A2719_01385 [Candidatus Ryanbacteria bacterium RIFCSPHIGHO2_01_FULL_45_22]
MVKSYSNLDPEKVLEAVRKHFATTSDEEVVRRAEELTPKELCMFTSRALVDLATTIISLGKYNKRDNLSTHEKEVLATSLAMMKAFLCSQALGAHARLFDRQYPLREVARLTKVVNCIHAETPRERDWRCLYYFAKRCRNYFSIMQAEANEVASS